MDRFGRCENINGEPAIGTGRTVVLTTAHMDHVPEPLEPRTREVS